MTPLVWATIFIGFGLWLGYILPMSTWLIATIVLLLGSMLTWRWRAVSQILMLATWVCIGALRSGISLPEAERGVVMVQERAMQMNEQLTDRLQRAGLTPLAMELCPSIVLGNKKNLRKETRTAFSRSGTGHLLALSGMHLGILYAMLHLLLLRHIPFIWRPYIATPITLCFIWSYTWLTGMSPSLVRAALMLSCCITFFRVKDEHLRLHRLALCAFCMWMIWPGYIRQLGFWLSMLAVFFITELYLPISSLLKPKKKRLGWLGKKTATIGELLLLSAVAQLGTLPLSIYYFHTLPLLGAVWSTLLIPLTGVLICATLLVFALPFPLLGSGLNLLTTAYYTLVEWAANLPGVVTDLYPSVWQVALLYALLGTIVLRTHIYIGRR